jgi:K+-transporting ATPase c subunit
MYGGPAYYRPPSSNELLAPSGNLLGNSQSEEFKRAGSNSFVSHQHMNSTSSGSSRYFHSNQQQPMRVEANEFLFKQNATRVGTAVASSNASSSSVGLNATAPAFRDETQSIQYGFPQG